MTPTTNISSDIKNPKNCKVIKSILSKNNKKLSVSLSTIENKYQATFENTGTGMIILNQDATISLANQFMEHLTGYPLEKLSGMHISKIVAEEDKSRLLRYHKQRRQKGGKAPRQYEFKLEDSNGAIKDIFVTVNVIPETQQSVASMMDITDLKEMEENLRKSKNKIEKLHQIAIKMVRCKKEDEIYQLIINAAEGILHFNTCTVDIVEDGFFNVKAVSSGVEDAGTRRMSVDEGIAGQTFKNKETYLIRDLYGNREAKPAKNSYRSAISAPLGEFGIFQVISTETNAFNHEDVRLTEILLSHATEALKRIRSEKKVKHLSFHDTLTDLYNRVVFDSELDRLDQEKYLPLSLIMSDVNGLKLVNDVFGHQKGDQLIIRVAEILTNSCRKDDILARWGGDEFAIILPTTTEDEAKQVLARVKKACKEDDFKPIQPSIALGVATKNDMKQNTSQVLKKAESRMYNDKLAESKTAHTSIINSLKKTLKEKSFETEKVINRLKDLSLKLGKAISLSPRKLQNLEELAAYHDLGETAIPEEILKKPEPLTSEEWEIIKRHPELGYQIARNSPDLAPIAQGILSHHEWWDGTGYPQELEKKEIPIISRVFSIVDAYNSLIQGRPYRKAVSKEEALEEIKSSANTQFDPELVKKFIKIM